MWPLNAAAWEASLKRTQGSAWEKGSERKTWPDQPGGEGIKQKKRGSESGKEEKQANAQGHRDHTRGRNLDQEEKDEATVIPPMGTKKRGAGEMFSIKKKNFQSQNEK